MNQNSHDLPRRNQTPQQVIQHFGSKAKNPCKIITRYPRRSGPSDSERQLSRVGDVFLAIYPVAEGCWSHGNIYGLGDDFNVTLWLLITSEVLNVRGGGPQRLSLTARVATDNDHSNHRGRCKWSIMRDSGFPDHNSWNRS